MRGVPGRAPALRRTTGRGTCASSRTSSSAAWSSPRGPYPSRRPAARPGHDEPAPSRTGASDPLPPQGGARPLRAGLCAARARARGLNQSRTARRLGVHRNTLIARLAAWGLGAGSRGIGVRPASRGGSRSGVIRSRHLLGCVAWQTNDLTESIVRQHLRDHPGRGAVRRLPGAGPRPASRQYAQPDPGRPGRAAAPLRARPLPVRRGWAHVRAAVDGPGPYGAGPAGSATQDLARLGRIPAHGPRRADRPVSAYYADRLTQAGTTRSPGNLTMSGVTALSRPRMGRSRAWFTPTRRSSFDQRGGVMQGDMAIVGEEMSGDATGRIKATLRLRRQAPAEVMIADGHVAPSWLRSAPAERSSPRRARFPAAQPPRRRR